MFGYTRDHQEGGVKGANYLELEHFEKLNFYF